MRSYGEYGDVKVRHKVVERAVAELNYPRLLLDLLADIINRSNADGVSEVSQETLGKLLRCSRSTVYRYCKRLIQDGIIETTSRGWGKTLTTVLIPVKNELNHICVKSIHNPNIPPNLKDLDINKQGVDCNSVNEYEEMRQAEIQKPRVQKPVKPIRTSAKKIDNSKLYQGGKVAEGEIIRACEEYGLPQQDHGEVVEHIQNTKGIDNKAAYLANMLVMVLDGKWELKSKPKQAMRAVRDHDAENRQQQEVHEQAVASLEKEGVIDPLLSGGTFHQSREYNEKVSQRAREILKKQRIRGQMGEPTWENSSFGGEKTHERALP